MQHVFLSYSRDDRPTAQVIAQGLEQEGFQVWWDKVLQAGQTYDEVTEDHLRRSGAVVVLWSHTSVKSRWVRAEATLGDRTSVVIPAMIEDAERPVMFELTQAADLIGWAGDREEERWKSFVEGVRYALAKNAENAPPPEGPAAAPPPVAAPTPAPEPAPAPAPAATAPVSADPVPPQPAPAAPSPAPAPTGSGSGGKAIIFGLLALVVIGGGGFALMQMGGGDAPEETETEIAASSCEVCPEMVSLPGGTFDMGSPSTEANRTGNESPVRAVTIAPISISKSEVTFAEWDLCIADGGCEGHRPSGPETGRENLPVNRISWQDAQAYVSWLSGETGEAYRLPTEAEWEYAARAGTSTAYWWGEQFDRNRVAGEGLSDMSVLPENPFGLVGMNGTLREWVEDCYVNNYTDAPTDGSAVTSGDCGRRVLRGGSWKDGAAEHRAANRARIGVRTRDSSYGFRVVRDGDT